MAKRSYEFERNRELEESIKTFPGTDKRIIENAKKSNKELGDSLQNIPNFYGIANPYFLAPEKPIGKEAERTSINFNPDFQNPFVSANGKSRGLPEVRAPETQVANVSGIDNVKAPATDALLNGLGSLQAAYSRLATSTEKQTSLREQRENAELEALTNKDTGLLAKQQAVLEGQLTAYNQKYNEYLQNSEGAREDLNRVQAKYPVLSRADVINNMSTGEKLTTALLTLVASGRGRTPINENPAFAVFNKSVDDAVLKNKLSYDQERQNLLQKHLWDEQDFNVFTQKAQANATMTNNMFNNNLALIKARGAVKGEEERALDAQIAGDTIKTGSQATMLNLYAAIQSAQQAKRKVDYDIKIDTFNRHRVVNQYGIDEAGNLSSRPKNAMFKTAEGAEKTGIANGEDEAALNTIILPLITAVQNGDKKNANLLVKDAESFKMKFPSANQWWSAIFSSNDILGGEAGLISIRNGLVKKINDRNAFNTYSLEEQAAFNGR